MTDLLQSCIDQIQIKAQKKLFDDLSATKLLCEAVVLQVHVL